MKQRTATWLLWASILVIGYSLVLFMRYSSYNNVNNTTTVVKKQGPVPNNSSENVVVRQPPAAYDTNHNVPYMRRIMSGVPADYTVVGFLKSLVSTNEEVYPLYGRASRTNAHRWNYYTLTDGLSNIRLPIQTSDGRDCTVDMGCEELYDGTTVEILGKAGPFQVKVYHLDFR